MSDSVRPHRRQPNRLPRPWDSPGKNTGVGCHFLLQCMKVKSESELAQSYPTLSHPMDCSPPGSSVHGFSRQEYWSGVPLPSPFLSHALYQMSVCYLYFFCPGNSILVCVLVAQLCPTFSDPMDCSPPGSSVHGFSRQEYWSGVPLPSLQKPLQYCKVTSLQLK